MALDASNDGLGFQTITAGGFLGGLGVNTHIPYTDGGYANLGNIAADLTYLGLNNVRDGITNGEYGSAPLASYITLAREGVKFTFSIAAGGALTTADLTAKLSLIDQVNEAVPGSVIAVEGANEINNSPISYNGDTDDLQAAIALQKDLYAAVKADPYLPGVAVDYFTGYDAYSIPDQTSVGVGPDPATTPGLADFDNQHPYPAYGTPPAPTVLPSYALQNEPDGVYGPAVYTETGYTTTITANSDNSIKGVNQDVQAKYTLDLLFDTASDGISRTYIFQLLDAYQADSVQGDDGFGLFGPNNMPKEAATAIHNLTTILADPSAQALGFTPAHLTYSVANMPTTSNSIALEKADGTYDVVVYNEPEIWNYNTNTEITAPVQDVTVVLDKTYATVEVFDPLSGIAPLMTLHNVSSVGLGLTDHPLIVQLDAPCYCPGTLILTDRGEVAVEALAIGDRVVTTAGQAEPIRWIGRRSYAGAFVAGQHLMLPVCITAGALADGVPHSDLWVSPGHAMFVDGQLVPAWRLINGVSVVQPDTVADVTYVHIELAGHEILLANGAPAESFLDDDCRGQFHNAADFHARYPDAARMPALAPRLEDGFGLQRLLERVAARAGVALPPEPAGPLRGFVDLATPGQVCGWALDSSNPEEPVALEVLVDGIAIACVLANGYRADLRRAGIGSGCHGFALALPAERPVAIVVRRVADQATLPLTMTASNGLLAA